MAPHLFSCILGAAACALNYCPRMLPHASASRHQEMFQVQPDVSAFPAVPGTLVSYLVARGSPEAERGIGIFICPLEEGHLIFDLELEGEISAVQLASDVPSYLGAALRASPYMKRNFSSAASHAQWVDATLGVPRRFGDGLGIAARQWLFERGLLGVAAPVAATASAESHASAVGPALSTDAPSFEVGACASSQSSA